MTLHLSIPQPMAPDQIAMIDLISEMRACNRNLDDILNSIPTPIQSMTPMGIDADGVSRGLVSGDDRATYVLQLDDRWTLHALILPRGEVTGNETRMMAQVPARLRRQFALALGTIRMAA